jgi:hypothetical protein
MKNFMSEMSENVLLAATTGNNLQEKNEVQKPIFSKDTQI